MNAICTRIFILCAALNTASALRADVSGGTVGAPPPAIGVAINPRPTHSEAGLTPSSQIRREQAWAMAAAIARTSGRDIIVCAVAPTGSMRPFFDENALLLLEAVPFGELRLGDVVTFIHPRLKTDVVHRLVEKRGEVFWSKGDHNNSMDDIYVTPENYHRRLIGVIYVQPDPAGAASGAMASAEIAPAHTLRRKRG